MLIWIQDFFPLTSGWQHVVCVVFRGRRWWRCAGGLVSTRMGAEPPHGFHKQPTSTNNTHPPLKSEVDASTGAAGIKCVGVGEPTGRPPWASDPMTSPPPPCGKYRFGPSHGRGSSRGGSRAKRSSGSDARKARKRNCKGWMNGWMGHGDERSTALRASISTIDMTRKLERRHCWTRPCFQSSHASRPSWPSLDPGGGFYFWHTTR